MSQETQKDTIEVTIEPGTIVLRRPNAGERNRTLIEATEETKTDKARDAVFIMKLLPRIITQHPFGPDVVIEQALDLLDPKEYDKILIAAKDLPGIGKSDKEKSDQQSGEEASTNAPQD